jgi:dihydroorotate dehydrogenase (NAD+) catalytic subunit
LPARAALGPDRPLIGINGAQSGLDIVRMLLSGASAVGMASPVMLRGYGVLSGALDEFTRYLADKGMDAAGLVGVASDRRKTFAEMPMRPNTWRAYIPDPTVPAG